MKIKNVIIGILIIAFAIFGMLEASGVLPPFESVVGEISYFRLALFLLIVVSLINTVSSAWLYASLFLLSLLFMVIEPNIAFILDLESTNIINNWYLLIFTVLICIGLKLILPKKSKRIFYTEKKNNIPPHTNREAHKESYRTHNLTSATEYVDCSSFTTKSFENNLGQLLIHFVNTDEYVGEGKLFIENNLGNLVIHVPKNWRVVTEISNTLGSVNNVAAGDASGPAIYIFGENILGVVTVKRV